MNYKSEKNFRPILSLFLAICLAASAFSITVFGSDNSQQDVLGLLSELKIMNGDPDGNFRLDDFVTRAEFTKLAVASSDYRNSVASNLAISPFYDVPYSNWSAPYVRVGVTNNLVSGYPDASFKPDDIVTFEEAVTIMLRVLGYSDSDFGVAWPSGQIGMADSLDMTDNLTDISIGSSMTRKDVSTLVYNTLRTKKKDSSSKLISIFDVAFVEDVTLISTSKEDSSIPGDEVFTDNGTYKIRSDFNYSYVGMKGDIALKDNKTVIGFFPKADSSPNEKYVVYSVLNDNIVVYKGGNMTTLDIPAGTVAYDGTTKTTYGAIKTSFEMGDVLNIKKTNGNIDYIVYKKGNMQGPYTINSENNWAETLGINSSTTIMRGGVACTISDIKTYDILYYIPELNMAFAYTTKVTGVYDKANPNKDNPTEIVVSGVTYKVEGANAFNKLSSSGNLALGETITLLLGKTNEVADVVTSTVTDSEIVGYVFETGTKTYTSEDLKDYSNYYIKVAAANGETYDYTCSQNYEDYKNSVVTVSINEGIAKISRTDSAKVSGYFRWDTKRFGDDYLASDVEILDVGTTNKNDPSLYKKIYPTRLNNVNINSNKILYCHKNSSGEIDKLILNDVTGDSYTFGVMTSAQNMSFGTSVSGSYSYIVNGSSYSFTSPSTIYSVNSGQGVRLSSASNPSIMSPLSEVKGTVTVTSAGSLTADVKCYDISADVQVYEKEYSSSTLYRLKPISDIIGSDNYTLYAYYDKLPSSGGRIRIIVAVKKTV